MLRRGARTDPCGTPFLRRRNLLLLLFPVVRVKLRLLAISMIILCEPCVHQAAISAACRWGLGCHTVAPGVRSTNTVPAFFLDEKLSSMSCVNRVTWSTVDLPCRKPACSRRSNGSMIGSTRAEMNLSRILKGTYQGIWDGFGTLDDFQTDGEGTMWWPEDGATCK